MPRWEVHLSIGMMAFLIILSSILLGSGEESEITDHLRRVPLLGVVILLGGGSLVLGSVLPDIDGRGKLRWIMGPMFGAFLFVPPLIGTFRAGGPIETMEFVGGIGSLLFLGGTLAGYLVLLVPSKHRGILHSHWTGVMYGSAWGIYVFYTASLAIEQSLMIGSMGAVGYGWHLALDGKLF